MKNPQNSQSPLVSVIVPIYNTSAFLGTCLKTLKNQTYKNLEIICIDDGSTDNSGQIADDYAKHDPRIKVKHQKNQGLSATRNAGLKLAKGEYVTFVDSDDAVDPGMILSMQKALQETNSDVAICSFKETYPDGKVRHFNSQSYPQAIYSTKDALAAMLLEKGFMVSATMKLFPKDFFRTVKFPLDKLHEDVGTTYKLILQAKKVVFLPQEYYTYCHHEDSIIAQRFDDRKLDLITLTDQMCDDIDHAYPDLKNVTKERRIRARFSILRQLPQGHPETPRILNYLKQHQNYIIKNPQATKTDKLALKLALLSPKLFQLAYKLFK